MWHFFRNIILGLLIAIMLFGSLGLDFSKISCSKGQQYVLGTEMPLCKKKVMDCCKVENVNSCNQKPKKDDRKKETFHIKIDYETYIGKTYELPGIISLVVYKSWFKEQQGLTYSYYSKYSHYRSNPPPLLKPILPLLQTFLI